MKTIQTGAHQFNGSNIQKYSMMLGGLNATRDVLAQYDPLVTGYGRLFMVRPPKHLEKLLTNKTKYFKHMLEYGNTQIQGLNDVSLESVQITGGYAGRSFEIPSVAKDETNSFTVTCYELSGSPLREYLHSWINTISDLQSGFSHYGGLIASGGLGYSEANHTAEFIYVVTDRTGMKVEYACMFANCFPKGYKNDQFNYQAGTHELVETSIEFSCVKYESIDINEKAKILLKNYQILVNSIEFNSGLNDVFLKDDGTSNIEGSGYNPKTGQIDSKFKDYFVDIDAKSVTGMPNGNNIYNYENGSNATPSWSLAGSNTNNDEL